MNYENLSIRASHFLIGAYDLHIHPAPSPFYRRQDDIELLQSANKANMAGILLKSHYEPTAARAQIANHHVNGSAKAYGSLVLNWPVGGLNPYAVHNALKRGTKIVYMPTRDAKNSLLLGDMPGDFFCRPGITILTPQGDLKPEVRNIMEIIRDDGAALATGHLSPRESILLCRTGIAMGVRMILTHPEYSRTKIGSDIQKELGEQGVYIEKCWYNIGEGECSIIEMVKTIRQVGAQHCYMTTDRGQGDRESPVIALSRFAESLFQAGISAQELHTMMQTIPGEILS